MDEARKRITQLHGDLTRLVDRDPDQEVWDRAFPVLHAVLGLARHVLPDDPVVTRIDDFVSVAAISSHEKLRAAEALLIVGQVMAALPEPRIQVYRQERPSWFEKEF